MAILPKFSSESVTQLLTLTKTQLLEQFVDCT